MDPIATMRRANGVTNHQLPQRDPKDQQGQVIWKSHQALFQNHQRLDPKVLMAPPLRPASPAFPKPTPVPQSIQMIHETVRQLESCLDPELKSFTTRLRQNVEPPAARLDRLVHQYEQQQVSTGRSTGLAHREKQIDAADNQVVVALLTEVRMIVAACDQKLGLYNRLPAHAVLIQDAQRLRKLYEWLVHLWKFGKEKASSQTPAIKHAQAQGMKRKREGPVEAMTNSFEENAQALKFAATMSTANEIKKIEKPVVRELCETDDDQPPHVPSASAKSPAKCPSSFYVDLTWAVDKAKGQARSKSEGDRPQPKQTPATMPRDVSKRDHIKSLWSTSGGFSALNLSSREHGLKQTLTPADSLRELDEVTKKFQEAARAVSRSIPQSASSPHASMLRPVNVFTPSITSRPEGQYTSTKPDGALIDARVAPNLATYVLRALGRHPSLPPLNHALAPLLSRQQIQKYNPEARGVGHGIAQAQDRAVKDAQAWWNHRRG